jgi:hypothetical protein
MRVSSELNSGVVAEHLLNNTGHLIERKLFDETAQEMLSPAGVALHTSSRVSGRRFNGNSWRAGNIGGESDDAP